MEKNTSNRLRRAVKDNNLFLVKRLIQKVDMRNPDPGPGRYTSLAWAAMSANEEIFEFLLNNGHDDEELSKDAENNTILILLSGLKPDINAPYRSRPHDLDLQSSALRMARLYYERYPFTLDWSNSSGKTALHMSSLKGNEEFVRMLSDMGGDIDLPDLQGNTPLHYASAWGHIAVVQLLIERGCRFATRNNEGFTAVDYAYSTATMETLQDCARVQFENNKRARKNNYQAQLAARAEQNATNVPDLRKPLSGLRDQVSSQVRLRSGSGTTSTSESTDIDSVTHPYSQASISSLSSNLSRPSMNGLHTVYDSSSQLRRAVMSPSPPSLALSSSGSQGSSFRHPQPFATRPPTHSHSALTPVATRMREKDADAIAQFMDVLKRGRSGSQGAVVDTGKPGPVPPLKHSAGIAGARAAIHKLRQSVSAAQLRPDLPPITITATSPATTSPGDELISAADTIPPEATTPRASNSGANEKHESITPPANRRSPFAILSRTTAQHGETSFLHRRDGSSPSVKDS